MCMVMSSVGPHELEPNIIRLRGDGLDPLPLQVWDQSNILPQSIDHFYATHRLCPGAGNSVGIKTSDVRPGSCRLYQAPREQI